MAKSSHFFRLLNDPSVCSGLILWLFSILLFRAVKPTLGGQTDSLFLFIFFGGSSKAAMEGEPQLCFGENSEA